MTKAGKSGLKRGISAALAFLLLGNLAFAQEMPPPRKMPRTPVNRQALPGPEKQAIQSREVKGPATIIDGEHLRIGNVDLRLFGVVPPQLSASLGPMARTALDDLTKGQDVECHVRDRDHDGRFLAICKTANTKADLALELLKRGLAVTARGSLQPTEYAAPYAAAEQAAENAKLGLWAATPPAAAVPATTPTPQAAAPAKTESANVPPLPAELKKDEKPSVTSPKPVIISAPPAPSKAVTPPAATAAPQDVYAVFENHGWGATGFFAHYQLLITGFVMLATALGIMVALAVERRRDRRDEMKAIAAALRGELLAARAVCQARLKSWDDADEKNASWPRIRATLYQAYVGRLGWLGAVLARQIASIYGQASDYSAYYNAAANGTNEAREIISKRQALQTLVQHIEQVLPKLAIVEQTGSKPKSNQVPKATTAPAAYENYNVPATAGQTQETTSSYVAPVSPVTPIREAAAPLWNMVRKFTNVRRPSATQQPMEEPDYTTLIEEEMARMSAEEQSELPPNILKIRSGRGS